MPSLAAALKDKDSFVRRFSAQALGNIGSDARPVSASLGTALKDSEKRVGESAADALSTLLTVRGQLERLARRLDQVHDQLRDAEEP